METHQGRVIVAQEDHLQTEINLYNAVKHTLPDKGTTMLDSGMKITTGFTEKWDQSVLANMEWVAPVPFPFIAEYKPDAKQVAYIRENVPAAYKILSNALTLTPKKPIFTYKE